MKNDIEVKIIKKHLSCSEYDKDVYILKYKLNILHYWNVWKEFPIYFEDENVLKDFIKTSYIFEHKFNNITEGAYMLSKYIYVDDYVFKVYFRHLNCKLQHYIFDNNSRFYIYEELYGDEIWHSGKTLSTAYSKYYKGSRIGLSETLEEKTYKLTLDENEQ